jgi:hypothetical protein
MKIKNIAPLVFIALAACGELSEQTLSEWARASDSAREKVVAAHFADNAQAMKKCITRMSSLPNTEKVKVLDAGKMCVAGMRVKDGAADKKTAKNVGK